MSDLPVPKPVRELYSDLSERPKAQHVPASALAKFKFKLQSQKGFSAVWSSRNLGLRDEVTLWAPEPDSGKAKCRVPLGHYVVPSLDKPSAPVILEVRPP